MQTVGQFDHQDADVAGHGDDHLAHGFSGRGLTVGDPVEFGDTVDQTSDLVAEVGGEFLQRVLGVLDGVVQQCRGQRGAGHAQLGQDGGDRQWVSDVRLPGPSQLILVQQARGFVGAFEQPQIGSGVVLLDRPEQGLEFRVAAAGAHGDPGESVAEPGDLLGGCLN